MPPSAAAPSAGRAPWAPLPLLLTFTLAAAVPTPPMAWNAWFAFRQDANASNILAAAQAVVDLGLRDAGYTYVNLDGGWQGGRATNGSITPNATKFPRGLAPLATAVHALGLKFGMYTDKGPGTCDGKGGSFPFYSNDAAYYAALGADYVKVDSCGGTQDHDGAMALYTEFQAALQGAYAAAGRPPPYLSLCGWYAYYAPLAFAAAVGQSWRIGPDALSWQNVLINWDTAANTWMFTGPGQYVDVDEIGPLGQQAATQAQQESQMNMVAIIGSPLLLSFDLAGYTPDTIAWAANPEVIAVHQDPHPRGPVYRRAAGGPLAARLVSPTTHVPCEAAANPAAVWARERSPASGTPGVPDPSYFLRPAASPGFSLHANHAWDDEYCAHNAQGWLAPAANNTCCDAACTNQLWYFNDTDATVTTVHPGAANVPGPYLTVDAGANAVFLNERYNRTDRRWDAQRFAFSDATGLLVSLADGTCVGAPAPQAAPTNVWGRALADGGLALVLLNMDTGGAARDVACDAACFAVLGVPPTQALGVRDIRARADAGSIVAGDGFVASVPAGGASRMFRFTPQ